MSSLLATSRGLKWVQHIFGGASKIFLILMGVYFGAGELTTGGILAGIAFITDRIDSEISYLVQVKVIDEKLWRK